MACKERPGILLQKFEELKRWQREQQEKLSREQEAQRELLVQEQRRTFQQLGLGTVDELDEAQQEETLDAISSEKSAQLPSSFNSEKPSPVHFDHPNPLASRKSLPNPHIPFDDVPLPSPTKDFNELIHENLTQNESNVNVKKATKTTKRPFLRRGEGLSRYGLNPDNIQNSRFVSPLSKSKPTSSASAGTKVNKANAQSSKSCSDIPSKHASGRDLTKTKKPPSSKASRSVPNNNPTKATIAKKLLKTKATHPTDTDGHHGAVNGKVSVNNDRPLLQGAWTKIDDQQAAQSAWTVRDGDNPAALPPAATWAHILARGSLAGPQPENKPPMTQRELEELRVFELLEQKAANSSFSSTASTVTRLLNRSLPSTPSKMSPLKLRLRDLENYPSSHGNPPEPDRSLHVRFSDNNNVIHHPEDNSTTDDESTMDLDPCSSMVTVTNVQHLRTDIQYGASGLNGVQNMYQNHISTQINDYPENFIHSGNGFEDSLSSQGSAHVYEQFQSYLQHISRKGVVETITISDNDNDSDGCGSWHGSSGNNSRQGTPDTEKNSGEDHGSEGTSFRELPSKFQDNEAWSDVSSVCSLGKSSSDTASSDEGVAIINHNADRTSEDVPNNKTVESQGSREDGANNVSLTGSLNQTTSTLNASVHSSNGSPVTNLLLKSDLLAKRLQELETEIEIFRKENSELKILRRTHEVNVKTFQKEKRETEQHFKEKEESLLNIMNSEKKKLAHEKKVFDRYAKQLKNQPNKMEREEIVALKLMVENLREELATKDSRWSATQVRTRDRVKVLETENTDLKLSVQKLKREKRELQEAIQQNARKIPKETDTKVMHAINNHISKLKPAIKNAKKPAVKADAKSPLLHNRPIWGARNPSTLRRNKSVPDMRARSASPEEPANKVIVKRVRNAIPQVRPDPQPISDNDSSDNSEPETNKIAQDRLDKLQQVVYETLYNNFPDYSQNSKDPELKSQQFEVEKTTDISGEIYSVPENSETIVTCLSTSDASPRDVVEPVKWTSPAKESMTSALSALDMTIETVNSNGTREKTFSDGRREIWYPDGVVKKVSADKAVVKIIYGNGDVKETVASEGVVKYYYAETQTWHSTYRDKTEILEFPNGQVERRTADGLTEITFPNGCVRRCHANGRDEWLFTDGTQVTTNTSGEKIVEMPNGQREIHTSEHKRREYPDGTVKLVYPDGLQETRYANGRVRLKDKDGNLVMDSGGDTK